MTGASADAETGSRASTEPSSTVSALTGFDPARWSDLCCALANARYALEYWEREARVCAPDAKWTRGPLHRGATECETLRELDEIVRQIAYGRPSATVQS